MLVAFEDAEVKRDYTILWGDDQGRDRWRG